MHLWSHFPAPSLQYLIWSYTVNHIFIYYTAIYLQGKARLRLIFRVMWAVTMIKVDRRKVLLQNLQQFSSTHILIVGNIYTYLHSPWSIHVNPPMLTILTVFELWHLRLRKCQAAVFLVRNFLVKFFATTNAPRNLSEIRMVNTTQKVWYAFVT